jgi:hypothetical protein
MNVVAAIATGAGLGIACYGSLWLGVRRLVSPTRQRGIELPSLARRANGDWGSWPTLATGRAFRLVLVGLTFYALAREDPALVPAALAGLWLARRWFLRHCGGTAHAD